MSVFRLGRRAVAINADLSDRSAPEAILDAAQTAQLLPGVLAIANHVAYNQHADAVREVGASPTRPPPL